MTAPSDDLKLTHLAALVTRQRRELEDLRAEAAARSVVDLARGVLMERLDCSAADARNQLIRIAQRSGASLTDLAAQIAGHGTPAIDQRRSAGPDQEFPAARAAADLLLAQSAMEIAAAADIASALLEEALAVSGAVAVAIWLIAPDGAIELASQAGFGTREASRWQRMPPRGTALAQRAIQHRQEFWWAGGRPEGDEVPLIGRHDRGARAVVPLDGGSGSVLGALEACWPSPLGEFSEPLRRQFVALAGLCAQVLGDRPAGERSADHRLSWVLGLLDGLHESVLFAPAIRGSDGKAADFRLAHVSAGFRDPAGRSPADLVGKSLLEAYPAAALPGSLQDQAIDVLATGEPRHVSVEVVTGTTTGATVLTSVRIARLFDGVAMAWRHAGDTERLATLLQQAQRLGQIGGWEENLATGTVHWTEQTFGLFGTEADRPVPLAELHRVVPEQDTDLVESFRRRLLADKAAAAAVFRIVRHDDGSVRQIRAFAEPVTDLTGGLVAVRGAYQDVSSHYHTQVALAATRDRLSETEERAEEEHRLAVRLQEAITPKSSHLVSAAGLEVAARYRPAGEGHLVSGDWYDAFLLPTKEVMLVIGDVAGHGIDAVTGMVMLRNCLRGLAVTSTCPADLLGWLNNAAYHLTEGIIATAVCALYHPGTRTLRWARAGHLPPALVRDGRARQLRQPAGLLLGAARDARYQEATTELKLGDTLLLFTDGLIERRDETIDQSLRALLSRARQPVRDVDEYADLLMTGSTSNTGDDACLLTVTLR
ncbi:MAG TPA: SpoIIE family protein phosphatase [Streptosporangiaceae bacterium]|nr:SpoIIE family protein phosphatase [Streptosporangiaceae bacterium]